MSKKSRFQQQQKKKKAEYFSRIYIFILTLYK